MASGIQKRAVLIAGPTASGKSALALKLARERNGIIINADAMQVYRELRVLTARPTPEEEDAVPHRLYGQAPAGEGYSVAQWLADAKQEMEACWERGRLPILVGGTGLYFKALEEGLAELPPIPDKIRQKWRRFEGNLHEELERRNPEAARRHRANDRQRLTRELEVLEATGWPLSHWQNQSRSPALLDGVAIERLFLNIDRQTLHARTEARFEAMIAAGALEEVRTLLTLKLDPSLPAMKAIGVPELAAHLRGELSLDEAVVRAKTSTRRYIKRQLTWWRGQMKGWRVTNPQSDNSALI